MTDYVDTSVIVAALTSEPATPRAQAWLADHDPDRLLISEWTIAEVSSALSIKLRSGQFDLAQRAAALALFNRLVAESLTVATPTAEHYRAAARFVDRHDLGLRAGDALHLAVAATHGATLCTLDRRLAEAGPPLGVAVLLL